LEHGWGGGEDLFRNNHSLTGRPLGPARIGEYLYIHVLYHGPTVP